MASTAISYPVMVNRPSPYHSEVKNNPVILSSLPDGQFDFVALPTAHKVKGIKQEGRIEGVYREYYPTGRLALEATYVNGKLHGTYQRWYSNGKPLEKATYLNGEMETDYSRWGPYGEQLSTRVANMFRPNLYDSR